MQQLEDYSVWGWERLFNEKGHFLATTDREFYNAYPTYAHCVQKRDSWILTPFTEHWKM